MIHDGSAVEMSATRRVRSLRHRRVAYAARLRNDRRRLRFRSRPDVSITPMSCSKHGSSVALDTGRRPVRFPLCLVTAEPGGLEY